MVSSHIEWFNFKQYILNMTLFESFFLVDILKSLSTILKDMRYQVSLKIEF